MAGSLGTQYPSAIDNIPSLDGGSADTTIKQEEVSSHIHCSETDKYPRFEPGKKCVRKTLKITKIDPDVLRRICNHLNIIRVLGGDWRTLAGELGYTVQDIKTFEQTKDANGPTGCLLDDWGSGEGHFVDEIIKILKAKDRDDVVKMLEAEIKKICG